MTRPPGPRRLSDRLFLPALGWARLRHHMRASARTILIVSALVIAGEFFGWFDQFEKGATDWLARQRHFDSVSQDIVVVGIGEDDYRDRFRSTSPLPSAPLLEILENLAKACPAVIGVDIVNGPILHLHATADCKAPPRVVYAITGNRMDVVQGHPAGFWKWFFGRDIPALEFEGFPPSNFGSAGVPVFPVDRDGIVRSYTRLVRAEFSSPRQASDVRSLNAALVSEYCEVLRERGAAREACRGYEPGPEIFLFGRWGENRLIPLDASEVLRRNFGRAASSLRDKIILVGGKFSAARDSYPTPNGTYYGVDLLGLAVDSDLNHYGVSEIEPWLALIWDLLVGASIVLLFAVLRPVPAFWASIAGTFLIAVGLSAFLFHVRSYALNFMVVGVGIIIHQIFLELEKLKDLEKAEAHIRALEQELRARPAVPPGS